MSELDDIRKRAGHTEDVQILLRIATDQEVEIQSLSGSIDEWIADFTSVSGENAQLRTELYSWRRVSERVESENAQLRTERDEALQREVKNADKLKHYRMYFIPKLEAERDELRSKALAYDLDRAGIDLRRDYAVELVELRAERDRLKGMLLSIRDGAKWDANSERGLVARIDDELA